MTSTSAISGTGFMKCIPMTFSGRRVAAPSLVIEIDDVLEARIVSGRVRRSSSPKTCVLTWRFSTTASITRSAAATSSIEVVARMRRHAAARSSAVILPFSASLARLLSTWPIPRSSAFWSRSRRTTACPPWAKTCAMPLPMVPAPRTATRSGN